MQTIETTVGDTLEEYLPPELHQVADPDTAIPELAKNARAMTALEEAIRRVPSTHDLYLSDARTPPSLSPESVHLVVTSPPYWTLKRYRELSGQLGHVEDYEEFLNSLDVVWQWIYHALAPGGRLICVVGDVCLSRRKNNGEHTCVPLHSSIQERCRKIGFSNLAPIIWHKIANATYEVGGNSRFLGKPYEPNGVIKNDIEYILMLRKPGGYRKPSRSARLLSILSDSNHKKWFQGTTSLANPRRTIPPPIRGPSPCGLCGCSASLATPSLILSWVRLLPTWRRHCQAETASVSRSILTTSAFQRIACSRRRLICSQKQL